MVGVECAQAVPKGLGVVIFECAGNDLLFNASLHVQHRRERYERQETACSCHTDHLDTTDRR